VQSVTGSYQSWTGFLRAACYNYKCPFDDQILIYAQRPDATAVLEMERWNRQFGRWVNRGAKSIAVFGDDGQNCLKLYFDVSDTHASRFSRPLPIWTMHPAFEPEVIETLEATFGNLAEKENLADAVRSACHNAVADNFTDYLQDLRDCREDSLLEELDDLNLEAFYRDALEVSVAYMLLTRLGLRADDYFSPDEFAHVYEFNTTPTINALGIAASEIADASERRTERMVNPALSNGLTAFLTTQAGVNSGFMIVQYAAASMVSENKVYAHPASVDSIPSSANQEDIVSMGTTAARKAKMILQNTQDVLADELLTACQAIDIRRRLNTHGQGLTPLHEAIYQHVRKEVAFYEVDREIWPDIRAVEKMIRSGELLDIVKEYIPDFE